MQLTLPRLLLGLMVLLKMLGGDAVSNTSNAENIYISMGKRFKTQEISGQTPIIPIPTSVMQASIFPGLQNPILKRISSLMIRRRDRRDRREREIRREEAMSMGGGGGSHQGHVICT